MPIAPQGLHNVQTQAYTRQKKKWNRRKLWSDHRREKQRREGIDLHPSFSNNFVL